MQPSLSLAAGIVAVLALAPTVRWFGLRFQRLVYVVTQSQDAALYVYHFVLLPGTLLHELSHWLAAKIMGVRTGRLMLMPVRKGNVARFGSVQIGSSDPLRESLIGAAPLAMGVLLSLVIARWRFGWQAAVPASWAAALDLWRTLRAAPDAFLWLYLLLSITNAMLPSESDRRSWRWVGAALLVALLALQFLGLLGSLVIPVMPWLARTANAIGFAALLAVTCDLLVGVFLMLVELGIGFVFGRWVDVA
ncbi:MAG: hypothetical protein GXY68_04975 [Chloroflexi bacterium]|nr:hypothetical protein [Chloroflexota bacterium]